MATKKPAKKVANAKTLKGTKTLENLDEYIVPASLHDDQGIMGAVKLAIDACNY